MYAYNYAYPVFEQNAPHIYMDVNVYGIRITCLPRDYETLEQVRNLFENVLGLGVVKSIKLKTRNIENSRTITSASVEFSQYNYENSTISYLASMPHGMTMECQHPDEVFSWPDGRGKMKHLSLQKYMITTATNHLPVIETERLEIPEGGWSSLHIPVLPSNHMFIDMGNGLHKVFKPRDDLCDFIENKLMLGKVRRIDFVERDDMFITPEGKICHVDPDADTAAAPKHETNVLAAFIHMEFWFNNRCTQQVRYNLDNHGQFHMRGFQDLTGFHSFYGTKGKEQYFVLKINHKPIPDADGKLNIHQLAAMNARLKEEMEKIMAENAELKARLPKVPETNEEAIEDN